MLAGKGYKAGSTCSEHQLEKSKKMKERAPTKKSRPMEAKEYSETVPQRIRVEDLDEHEEEASGGGKDTKWKSIQEP